jgi:archaemetzincin
VGCRLRAASIAALLAAGISLGCRAPPPLERKGSGGLKVDSAPPSGGRAPPPANAFLFDPSLFAVKAPPRSGDWLQSHNEPQQSFDEYVRSTPARPTMERRAIVLQPLGTFSRRETALVYTLRDYLAAFFQMETRVAAPLPLPAFGMRQVDDGPVQYRTDVINERLLGPRLPADAVCTLGITMADLYPDPSWNYVFGMASLAQRVGVYSLARYGPAFNHEPDDAGAQALLLRRALLVVAHETAHMFSLPHCRRYECLMNGVNSLAELDRGTPWLCPDCLRKLQWNVGLDVSRHYRDLLTFYAEHRLPDQVDWLDRRLSELPAELHSAPQP